MGCVARANPTLFSGAVARRHSRGRPRSWLGAGIRKTSAKGFPHAAPFRQGLSCRIYPGNAPPHRLRGRGGNQMFSDTPPAVPPDSGTG
jgi:hypothetical protein